MSMTDKSAAARDAISRAGGAAAMARAINVSPPAITYWLRRGIPADRVLAVEQMTGVSRHVLRPDVFGPGQQSEATA